MRIRTAVVALILVCGTVAMAACGGCRKTAEPPKHSTNIVPPEVHVAPEQPAPTPTTIEPQLPPIRIAGSGEQLIQHAERILGSRERLLTIVREYAVRQPRSTFTPDSTLAYAVLLDPMGGLIDREGCFAVMRNGVPVAAYTTKVLDYRTGQKQMPRPYGRLELEMAAPALVGYARSYRAYTGEDAPFIIVFSESYREAAIEALVSRDSGVDAVYDVRMFGPAAILVWTFRGQSASIAGELFPFGDEGKVSPDLNPLGGGKMY